VRKLINDIIQYSDAIATLKSQSLADITEDNNWVITLDKVYTIDSIGVGNTDATEITVNGDVIALIGTGTTLNGLYLLSTPITTNTLTISTDGTFIGRIGAGQSRFLGAAPSREPGFYTTAVPRVTAGGQGIDGAGGIVGRRIGLDFRYKIDEDVFDDFEAAYVSQISKGFAFFMYFDKEQHRIKWKRLYAATDNELLFQSSVNRFLYSRRFDYRERF